MASDYRDLIVWQKAMDVATETYKLVKLLPKEETYALSDQMRRAAVSIPSNIAEGNGRNTIKEYLHFLAIARGSKSELETQIMLAIRVGLLSQEQATNCLSLLDEVSRLLKTLANKLQSRI